MKVSLAEAECCEWTVGVANGMSSVFLQYIIAHLRFCCW